MSPIAPTRRDFVTPTALAAAFAEWTAERLAQAIEKRGAALLVVSGGTTPVRYFHALASQPIDWSRVAITLADERRVPDDDRRSNARLVREALLRDHAAEAQFSPLADSRLEEDLELAAANARIAALPSPADLVILGMGEDGHTASWFPGAEGLVEAVDPGARALVAPIRAPGAAEPRLTLTGHVILRAHAIALHIEGEAKAQTLARALGDGPIEAMPIRAVLRQAGERLTIFYAPSA
jgi:6-phosphogluconolactonase